MWPETVTGCVCESPGWCERHQCLKAAEWHLACRLMQSAFETWEAGGGPCLNRPSTEFVELPRCRHRSVQPVGEVECDLCGGHKTKLPVYDCALFGRCTPRRYGTRTEEARRVVACVGCEKHSPMDEVDASMTLQSIRTSREI